MPRLGDFSQVVGQQEIDSIRTLAEGLRGMSITEVNSTSYGGGVAEILRSMVPLIRDAGLDVRWEVIEGSFEFFSVTKKIHNALQGMNVELTDDERRIYLEYNKMNSERMQLDTDFVVVEDTQPTPMIDFHRTRRGKWVWRCHVDLSTPSIAVWNFLDEYINRYDAAVFSSEKYVIPTLKLPKVSIIPPSINPLSDKNREIPEDLVLKILERHGVKQDKPIITQVGRFDPWKDTTGAIDVYRMIKKEFPQVQLLLVASMANDDPEGWLYFEKTARHAGDDGDIHILTDLIGVKDLEVNAFQRASDVILQMSTREGFGLTVSEGLWKGVPVVGRNVGGIPLQVINGSTGFLVDTTSEAAEKTIYLLKNQEEAKKMGENGKEHVFRNFLITRLLRDHLRLLNGFT
ncbi:MAG TPA: glycosyltransferase [Candidatus Bathyarchaeia archaeon]|nr:glycosyltransferase [Candidatus Bathyarchaeia archaeon]